MDFIDDRNLSEQNLQSDKKIIANRKKILYDIYKKDTIKLINSYLRNLCLAQLEQILEDFENDLMFK